MNILLLVSCLVAAAAADKSPAAGSSEAGTADSYENGVGTSFTVPLNPPGLKYISFISIFGSIFILGNFSIVWLCYRYF